MRNSETLDRSNSSFASGFDSAASSSVATSASILKSHGQNVRHLYQGINIINKATERNRQITVHCTPIKQQNGTDMSESGYAAIM